MATVIVAAAGAMLVGGLVASNRSAELRIERALLTQLLASRLALLDDEISQQTPTSGAFSPPLEDFTWTLEQMPLAGGPLVEAAVTVNRRDDAAHVVTYRRLAAE